AAAERDVHACERAGIALGRDHAPDADGRAASRFAGGHLDLDRGLGSIRSQRGRGIRVRRTDGGRTWRRLAGGRPRAAGAWLAPRRAETLEPRLGALGARRPGEGVVGAAVEGHVARLVELEAPGGAPEVDA